MNQPKSISLVCCDGSEQQLSKIVSLQVDLDEVIQQRLIDEQEQTLAADEAKGLHLAAEHPEHGKVTYLQEVHEGGFFVYVGQPGELQEHWFGPGSVVGFIDHQGSGHASKVGPDGCRRTFRMLRGHMDQSEGNGPQR